MFDFANILFAGPCNRACPFCIGRRMPERVNVSNLDVFPLHGLDAFVEAVIRHRIPQVVFTGTTTDPQLYRYEPRLLELLRSRLPPTTRFSLHTNGVLALRRMDVFNRYDRACISLPSFVPTTYARMTGSCHVPDLAGILAAARIPMKVSCVVNEANAGELQEFLAECHRIGVRRLVLRTVFGEVRSWRLPPGPAAISCFKGNPVYDYDGMEVTVWDFERCDMRSLSLFADGTIGSSYLITRTPMLAQDVAPMPPRRTWSHASPPSSSAIIPPNERSGR